MILSTIFAPTASRGFSYDDISAARLDPELGFLRFTVYNQVAKTGVSVKGKGFNKPLYDTGALYNDFDYDVVSSTLDLGNDTHATAVKISKKFW